MKLKAKDWCEITPCLTDSRGLSWAKFTDSLVQSKLNRLLANR